MKNVRKKNINIKKKKKIVNIVLDNIMLSKGVKTH